MNKYNRGRRGATLAELAIVIAVIAIVAVMVTSFIVMIDGSRDISQMKLEAMQDIVLAESVIESFIIDSENNKLNYENGVGITFNDQPQPARKIWNGNGESIQFLGNKMLGVYRKDAEGNPNNTVLTFETVTNVQFFTHGSGNDILYYCTITYDVGGDSNFEYTFCVNPYAGENIGGNKG